MRRLVPTCALLSTCVLLLAACGDDSEGSSPDDETTTTSADSGATTESTTTESTAPSGSAPDPGGSAGADPCAALSTDEVAALLGSPVAEGESSETTVDASGDGFSAVYRAATCTWAPEADGAELRVQVSKAADFEGGAVVCTAGSGLQDEEVPGLGDAATWSYNDPRQKGELIACTDSAVVSVEIEGLAQDGLQGKAITIAQEYLSAG